MYKWQRFSLILRAAASLDWQFPSLCRSQSPSCQWLALATWVLLRKFLHLPVSCSGHPTFSSWSFRFYIDTLDPPGAEFCVEWENKNLVLVFFVWISSFSAPFVEDILSPVCVVGTFIKMSNGYNSMDLYLQLLFNPIDWQVCIYASTILVLFLWLCSIV